MTVKLYDSDSFLFSFESGVVSCEKCEKDKKRDIYAAVLEQTAFFPEGGGQSADSGIIICEERKVNVLDVQIGRDGVITHYLDGEIRGVVRGEIDADMRLRRMQNHSGEHIISGLAHRMFGCENVGFHLGSEMTIDLDTELDEEQLRRIEDEANVAVARDIPIIARYPSEDELAEIDYRSKKEIDGDVRIVSIEGVDSCACCAPHVKSTGQIGIIKIIGSMRYKGGVRLTAACGRDALDIFRGALDEASQISRMLSAKPHEIAAAVSRICAELEKTKFELVRHQNLLADMYAGTAIQDENGNMLIFADGFDTAMLRRCALGMTERGNGICAAFSGSEENGYSFVMASKTVAMRDYIAALKSRAAVRGGGDNSMVQGNIKASRAEIEKAVAEN